MSREKLAAFLYFSIKLVAIARGKNLAVYAVYKIFDMETTRREMKRKITGGEKSVLPDCRIRVVYGVTCGFKIAFPAYIKKCAFFANFACCAFKQEAVAVFRWLDTAAAVFSDKLADGAKSCGGRGKAH